MTSKLTLHRRFAPYFQVFLLAILLVFQSCAISTSQELGRNPTADESTQFYDEVMDESGNVRPQYEGVWKHYQSLSKAAQKTFREQSLKDFKADNALAPLPRIMTDVEYDELRKGVEQRGRALTMFLKDHYSGKKSYEGKVISKDDLNRIIRRSGEEGFAGVVDPGRIAFPYGPDIIRDSDGVWRVLEDNPGFIGGIGDLKQARQSLLKRMPEYKKILKPVDQPEDYYKEMGRRYKSKPGKGRTVVYMIPPYADNEDLRLKKLYKDQGLQVVTPYTKAKLVTTPKGLFVEEKINGNISRKRVGYLVLNGEHGWVDVNHPATKLKDMFDELQYWMYEDTPHDIKSRAKMKPLIDEYLKNGTIDESEFRRVLSESNIAPYLDSPDRKAQRLDGLIDLYSKGALDMNYTPGIDFIGDKEFTQYVEEIVRFYLNEEPILKNVPTENFVSESPSGKMILNEVLLKRVMKNKSKYVIKQVDGRGGDGIWVGSKTSAAEWLKAEKVVRASPGQFQVQEFKHLSVLGDLIVDLRMIAAVDSNSVYVSPTPWGRGLPISGNGKVNISDQGLEVAMMVVKARGSCSSSMSALSR